MAYQAVLLDIDGVLTVSWRALPGAIDAVAKLRASGCRMRLVTNTTSLARGALSDVLKRAGFEVAAHEIFSAAAATASYLRAVYPGARCFLLTSGDVGADFEGIELAGPGKPADVVVLGGAGIEFSHAALNHVFRLLQSGAPLVAMHRNLYWRTADGLCLDAGSYILGLEKATGARTVVIGKPTLAFYQQVLADLGVTGAEAIMVGDDIEADVRGARDAGIKSILVRTGKFREVDLERPDIVPDAVLGSIAELPGWLLSVQG